MEKDNKRIVINLPNGFRLVAEQNQDPESTKTFGLPGALICWKSSFMQIRITRITPISSISISTERMYKRQ